MTTDLEDVFEHTPGLLFVADADGKLLRQSKALTERFGARLREHASLRALAGPDESATVQAFLAELARTGEPMTRVLRWSEADGKQTAVRCVGRRSPGGMIHGQLEVLQDLLDVTDAHRIEQALLRAVMDTLDIVLWAIDRNGTIVFQDGKALEAMGMRRGQLLGCNAYELYPPEQLEPIRKAAAGTPVSYPSEAHGVHCRNWNVPLRTSGGEVDYIAGLSVDVTAELASKRELERQLETIQDQQRAILELSAPIINVWDSVLCVPLIGAMDNDRANELIERLLGAASHSGTRYVILDLTGVDALDTSIAGHLLRLLRSLRLLGVEGLVTGISPQVSQTMVGLGVELEDVQTFRSLRESLRFCMRTMYQEKSAQT